MVADFFDIDAGDARRFVIYNNVAEHRGIQGRLTAEIVLGDEYRLDWEFEWYDEDAAHYWDANPHLRTMPVETPLPPIVGVDFEIAEPWSYSSGPKNFPGRKYLDDGTFTRGHFADPAQEVEGVSFYLVNFTMGPLPLRHRGQLHPEDSFDEHAKQVVHGVITEDRFHTRAFKDVVIDAYVDDYWRVRLELNRRLLIEDPPRTGFWTTTAGTLCGPHDPLRKHVRTVTLEEAHDRIARICALLSFANGGLTASIYEEGSRLNLDDDGKLVNHERAAIVSISATTPIQGIGMALYPPRDHDLGHLLATLPAFERVLDVWGDNYQMLLADYHKALSPYAPFRSRARSIGSALEYLAMLVLRHDFDGFMSKTQFRKLTFVRKLEWLAYVSGIPESTYPASFVEIKKMRNESVHPALSIDEALRDPAFRSAVCLFEELFLWRIGYEGRYCPKTGSTWTFEPCRYDLQLRLPHW